MNDMDTSEMFSKYLDMNKIYNFEGSNGVRRMKKVMKDICGYGDAWGGTMNNFFSDNPGAIEAVMTWIENNIPKVSDWEENLEMETYDDSEEESDEEFEV